jgi:hypothetical protein
VTPLHPRSLAAFRVKLAEFRGFLGVYAKRNFRPLNADRAQESVKNSDTSSLPEGSDVRPPFASARRTNSL